MVTANCFFNGEMTVLHEKVLKKSQIISVQQKKNILLCHQKMSGM